MKFLKKVLGSTAALLTAIVLLTQSGTAHASFTDIAREVQRQEEINAAENNNSKKVKNNNKKKAKKKKKEKEIIDHLCNGRIIQL